MHPANVSCILVENTSVESKFLQREVKLDFYLPRHINEATHFRVLLINDGQDMTRLGFTALLEKLYSTQSIEPILFVGIHAGEQRKLEYGMAGKPDFKGRGSKAGLYTSFILEELVPLLMHQFKITSPPEISFAGFSLGGLSAMDIVWKHPDKFKKVGIFSGSLWWRNVDQHDPDYDDNKHRLMHEQVRLGKYAPELKFFFQCGNMDETKDRNKNGIIDSIDDTQDLIKELVSIGYDPEKDIAYLELKDGHHDVATWGRAMPEFLKWGWGIDDSGRDDG